MLLMIELMMVILIVLMMTVRVLMMMIMMTMTMKADLEAKVIGRYDSKKGLCGQDENDVLETSTKVLLLCVPCLSNKLTMCAIGEFMTRRPASRLVRRGWLC